MNRLQGKVAIVTGGSLGIGRACVQRMAEEGAQVALWDVLDREGQAFAAELAGRKLAVRYWHVDVTEEAAVARAMGEAVAHFGRLDILVNNAGIAGASGATDQIQEAEWDRVMAVNVKGPFFCTKHAVAAMRRAGGGSVLNLSSIYGLVGAKDAPPYCASKGALRLMTKTDALLYAEDRIRVNSIHPGFIWTPMVQGILRGQADPEAAKRGLERLHPLGHMGEPDDIAMAAVYLASDEAKFVTGAELVVDGGYTAR